MVIFGKLYCDAIMLPWLGVHTYQPSNVMALGYGILNVAVICDSAWSGSVPVAASVADSSSTGISTGTTGAVPVEASY